MKMLNRRALTYVVLMSLVANPAFAGGISDLLARGRTAIGKIFTGGAEKAATAEGAEIAVKAEAQTDALMGLRASIAHTDQLEKETLGIFKNLQARVSARIYSKTLGRDIELNNLINDLADITSTGVALQGPEHIGKGQLLIGLQEEINKGAVNPVLINAKVIEVAANNSSFDSISSLKTHFESLAKITNGNEIIILHFNDIKPFIKAGQNRTSIDSVIELAKRVLGKDRVKVVIRGNQDQIEMLAKSSQLVGSLRRQNIKELPLYVVDKIVSAYVKRIRGETGIIISEKSINKIMSFAQTYYSSLGMPTSANTLAMKVATFKNTQLNSGESLVVKYLAEKLEALEAIEISAREAVTGKADGVAYARQLLTDLPAMKAEVSAKAEKTLIHFKKMDAIRNELLAKTPNSNGRFSVVIEEIEKEITKAEKNPAKFSDELKNKIEKLNQLRTITDEDVAMAVYRDKNGAVKLEELILEHRPKALEDLENEFKKNIFGQDHIIKEIAAVALNLRSKFRDTTRLLGKFSLNGDPGSAKTDIGKLVARIVYGDENKIIRIDMSEYKDARSAGRFTGADPGLVGYDALTDLVSQAKRIGGEGVILVDELTRGDIQALEALLKLLEEATFTNTRGETENFSKFIVIFTSNVGEYGEHGLSSASSKDDIGKVFAEFYNIPKAMIDRIDHVFMTAPLEYENAMRVLEKFIGKINDRIAIRVNKIELSDSVKEKLLKMAQKNDAFAPRDIRRMTDTIETEVKHLLDFGFYKNARGDSIELKSVPGDLIKVDWDDAVGLVISIAK